jgi:hypothetical protein
MAMFFAVVSSTADPADGRTHPRPPGGLQSQVDLCRPKRSLHRPTDLLPAVSARGGLDAAVGARTAGCHASRAIQQLYHTKHQVYGVHKVWR